jgi:hypothetical protein
MQNHTVGVWRGRGEGQSDGRVFWEFFGMAGNLNFYDLGFLDHQDFNKMGLLGIEFLGFLEYLEQR